MTEAEWLGCTDPQKMLEFLRGKGSDRKLRLFAAACSRHVLDNLTPHRIHRAVGTAEKYADGLVTEQELRRVYSMACEAANKLQWRSIRCRSGVPVLDLEHRPFFAANTAHPHKPFLIGRLKLVLYDVELRAISPKLLHCIFGSLPFLPVNLSPAWLAWNDGTVQKIAQAIYDERGFDRMPIMADALEEAGCTNQDILKHCREPG